MWDKHEALREWHLSGRVAQDSRYALSGDQSCVAGWPPRLRVVFVTCLTCNPENLGCARSLAPQKVGTVNGTRAQEAAPGPRNGFFLDNQVSWITEF